MSDIDDTDQDNDDRAARIADLDDDEPCEVCGHLQGAAMRSAREKLIGKARRNGSGRQETDEWHPNAKGRAA